MALIETKDRSSKATHAPATARVQVERCSGFFDGYLEVDRQPSAADIVDEIADALDPGVRHERGRLVRGPQHAGLGHPAVAGIST